MMLVNRSSNDATFDITTANGRHISVVFSAGGSVGLDLSAYSAPFGIVVGCGGDSANLAAVSEEATVTVADSPEGIKVEAT